MKKEDIDKSAIRAIRKHYRCAGSPPCSELENCRFCSGKNTAYDCNECGADEFLEGFLIAAEWRINSVWNDSSITPDPMQECLVLLNDPMRKGFHIGRIENQGTNKGKWNIYGYFTPSLHEFVIRWAYLKDLILYTED